MMRKENKMKRELKISHGLNITESDDMGVFLHFEKKDGSRCGISLNELNTAKEWAQELLDESDVT
jgi:hypothetical protein